MKTLLFDLDGTLIDSALGIGNCMTYAFAQVGHAPPDAQTIRAWIGPPLRTSFGAVFGAEDPRVEAAVAHYRDRFETHGWQEYAVYRGIAETVVALAARGHRMAIVTSKNEPHARRIVAALPFAQHFVDVIGAAADGRNGEKAELIGVALSRLQLRATDCWMIGDRRYDMLGARAHGVPAAGVLWGFGDAEELQAAGAAHLLAEPAALLGLG